LIPPSAAPFTRGARKLGGDGLPRQARGRHLGRRELPEEHLFACRRGSIAALIDRSAETLGELTIELRRIATSVARISAASRSRMIPSCPWSIRYHRDAGTRRQQLSSRAKPRAPPATLDEPLETYRHLDELTSERRDQAVDDAARDQRLPDRGVWRPRSGRCWNTYQIAAARK